MKLTPRLDDKQLVVIFTGRSKRVRVVEEGKKERARGSLRKQRRRYTKVENFYAEGNERDHAT